MNTQTTANTMYQNFRQNGLTRNHPSFFGQVIDATPQDAMLIAFRSAGLSVASHNFFSLPHNEYAVQQVNLSQPKAPTKARYTFRMPKSSRRVA